LISFIRVQYDGVVLVLCNGGGSFFIHYIGGPLRYHLSESNLLGGRVLLGL